MPTIFDRLASLGLVLPEASKPVASYIPAVVLPRSGLVLVSGQIPVIGGALIATGKVPTEVTVGIAQQCARQCVLNGLAALRSAIGDLARLRRVAKLEVFVACDPSFCEHPKVANGASDLLVELLGDNGRHARAAVGCPSLPLNAPVEIAFTFVID